MKPHLSIARFFLITLSILCVGGVQAGWFGPDNPNHFYIIHTKPYSGFIGNKVFSKGEPWEKDAYTIFIRWPEGGECKINKDLVTSIQDTGTLSPDEVKEKEAREKQEFGEKFFDSKTNFVAPQKQGTNGSSDIFDQVLLERSLVTLFAPNNKSNGPHFVPETLAKARKLGANDYQIKKAVLDLESSGRFRYRDALNAGYSLDDLAEYFKKEESGQKVNLNTKAEKRSFNTNEPYEEIVENISKKEGEEVKATNP